jgi:secretion/DNA translocation related TadE-like protein
MSRGGRDAPDSGFATVWVLAAMAILAAVTGVVVAVGVATLDRHRAAAAADAVALKVALDAIDGPAVACRDGAFLGRLNGARLTRCVLDGAVATVTVTVSLPGPLARLGPAVGTARAGPASDAPPGKPTSG